MGRPKGSKNKEVKCEISVTQFPACEVDPSSSNPNIMPSTIKIKANPLIGFSMDEIRGFIKEINPLCKRGGCLHEKELHYIGSLKPSECHEPGCRCLEFLS